TDLYLIPDRAHALGAEALWISLDQYSSPRGKCVARMATLSRAASSRRVAGGWDFRVAPPSGGISGVDHRAEECADGFFLFTRTPCVDAVYRVTKSATGVAIESAYEAARERSNPSSQTQSVTVVFLLAGLDFLSA